MGLFTSFYSGVSGLTVSQYGLNTTAHNLSNAATPGYTRQQNINTDKYYQDFKITDQARMQVGYGSTVAAVRQIRNEFLDKDYRVAASRLSFYSVLETTEQEVEDILGEMEGVEFEKALTEFWGTVETLSTNSESITDRELFLAKAEEFLERATDTYQALREYQINLNTQIEDQVDAINKIADQIRDLNDKIATAEASGMENANDYRDQRNLLMDRLAEYTNYEYRETYNHMVTIRINNAPLVEDSLSFHMECKKLEYEYIDKGTGQTASDKLTSPMYTVEWQKPSSYGEVYNVDKAYSREAETDMGSLLGILTARGNKFGVYTDIPVDPNKNELDLYNNSTGNSILMQIESQLDLLIHKVVTAVNDAFAPNAEIDGSGLGLTDANGNAVTGRIKVLDANRCPVGTDPENTIGTEVFSRKQADRYTVYDLTNPVYLTDEANNPVLDENGKQIELSVAVKNQNGSVAGYKLYVYNEEDPDDIDTLYSLQNLGINGKVKQDYSYLPVMSNPASGKTGEYDLGEKNVYAIIFDKWKSADTVLDPNTCSKFAVDTFYDGMVGSLATQGSIWSGMVKSQAEELNKVENDRQQTAGVSTEEEMVSLLMYQHAYNAASRYITTIDDMLEHIIERLG